MEAYFDIFSGISGNMVLGALIDLGVDREKLEKELDKLGLSNEYQLKIEQVQKQGITGSFVEVECQHFQGNELNDKHQEHQDGADNHEHDHHHRADNHEHNHQNDHQHHHDHSQNDELNNDYKSENNRHDHHNHGHHGRNLADINRIIDDSSLADNVKNKSKEIFMNLARAEAKIHGKDVNEIHFHEVGAVDAIVDIVGSVIGLDLLGVDRIYASNIHTGTGFVSCDHGKMPVPAPATMELLSGIPVYSSGIKSELVTPTGAAFITTLAEDFGPRPEMKIDVSGYGAGSHNLEIPNLLRINLGHVSKKKHLIEIVETNIDDMNPEFYDYIMEKLFAAGALDVYFTSIQMKKNRPAVKVSVLVTQGKSEEIADILLAESTSLGVRVIDKVWRYCLERQKKKIITPWGEVGVKIARRGDKVLNIAPEYED